MERTLYIIALIGIFGTIAGVIVGHWLALSRSKYEGRKIAGIRLRNDFSNELAILQRQVDYEIDIVNILECALNRHQKAVNEFELFLSDREVSTFREAWENYYSDNRKTNGAEPKKSQLGKYHYLSDKNGRGKAIKNIKHIMSLTI